MAKPLAVAVGFIGKLPVAGMSLYVLHYLAGLKDLGYEVHYVERQNGPEECYDPVRNVFTDDASVALDYLRGLLPEFGIPLERISFIDRRNVCHGSGWKALCDALDEAEFVLTLADPTWFDELERCPRRGFVDGDPLFTQVAMGAANGYLKHYNTLFSYCTRMGKTDCSVPSLERRWIATRPVVVTRLWDTLPAAAGLPLTTVMNWGAWEEVAYDGRVYGHKGRAFESFIDLPRSTDQAFELAVGGPAPKQWLRDHGWHLINPLEVTGAIGAYKEFIARSRADFGIAKHAYIASRSGWFSDRSTCYLASGRPVLHQDTGFTDWLPAGEGVLAFSDASDVLECIKRLDMDYERHARAARRIAEEHFEASRIVGRMLDDAGYR